MKANAACTSMVECRTFYVSEYQCSKKGEQYSAETLGRKPKQLLLDFTTTLSTSHFQFTTFFRNGLMLLPLQQGYVFTGVCDSVHRGWGGGVCMHGRGGMCGGWGMRGRGVCMVGVCMHGWGACVVGRHVWQGVAMHGRRDGHCSGRYASYWNAFLFCIPLKEKHHFLYS